VVRYNVTSKPFLSQNASSPIASSSYVWFNIAGGLKKSELRETREIAKLDQGNNHTESKNTDTMKIR